MEKVTSYVRKCSLDDTAQSNRPLPDPPDPDHLCRAPNKVVENSDNDSDREESPGASVWWTP
jgi:hypothetical protein